MGRLPRQPLPNLDQTAESIPEREALREDRARVGDSTALGRLVRRVTVCTAF